MEDKRRLLIGAGVLIIIVAIAFQFTMSTGRPEIKGSWTVLYSSQHTSAIDGIGAQMIADKYGCTVERFDPNNPYDLNVQGKNIILIGGGSLASEFPWLQQPLSIAIPENKPEVYWGYSEDDGWFLKYTKNDGTEIKANPYPSSGSLGSITTGWDSTRRRYVVNVIGGTGTGTVAGCALLTENPLPTAGEFYIYQTTMEDYTGSNLDSAPRQASEYSCTIIYASEMK